MDKFLVRHKRKLIDGTCDEGTKSLKHNSGQLSCHRSCLFRKVKREGLDCDYGFLFNKQEADDIFAQCEDQLEYNSGRESQVHVFGKWHNIPRKQVRCWCERTSYCVECNVVFPSMFCGWIPTSLAHQMLCSKLNLSPTEDSVSHASSEAEQESAEITVASYPGPIMDLPERTPDFITEELVWERDATDLRDRYQFRTGKRPTSPEKNASVIHTPLCPCTFEFESPVNTWKNTYHLALFQWISARQEILLCVTDMPIFQLENCSSPLSLQVAHGDEGLSYTFSGKTVLAKRWNPLLADIRDKITSLTGFEFNFVLVNR